MPQIADYTTKMMEIATDKNWKNILESISSTKFLKHVWKEVNEVGGDRQNINCP